MTPTAGWSAYSDRPASCEPRWPSTGCPEAVRSSSGSRYLTGLRADRAVVQVDHAVAESPLARELERPPQAVAERGLAAADHDRRDEQMALVDKSGGDRVRGQLRPADRQVGARRRFQRPHGLGLER